MKNYWLNHWFDSKNSKTKKFLKNSNSICLCWGVSNPASEEVSEEPAGSGDTASEAPAGGEEPAVIEGELPGFLGFWSLWFHKFLLTKFGLKIRNSLSTKVPNLFKFLIIFCCVASNWLHFKQTFL